MIAYMSERENVVEQVNTICMHLFDTWCEARSLTPLAYLMHCWPLVDSTPSALRRLGHTMRDLRLHHRDQLDSKGFHLLCEMADLIEELTERPARTVRLIAVGDAAER